MRYRMYFFLPYHLSGIQKGIQAGHAALEYAYKYGHTPEYKSFIENDKTWILLNGGTTRSRLVSNLKGKDEDTGDLNEIATELLQNRIPFEIFEEPDLNYALTAICFLADERVWDFENYPEPDEETKMTTYENMVGGIKNVFLRNLIMGKHLA